MASVTGCAAVIIAGGGAKRFGGQVKPMLEVGGERILDRQLAVLRQRFDDIVIAANDPLPYAYTGLAIVADRHVDAGPTAGLDAAFSVTTQPYLFAVAGDMPYLHVAAIDVVLAGRGDDFDIVAPKVDGYYDPLHALYARSCAAVVERRLNANRYRFSGLLNEEDLRVNDVREQVLREVDAELKFLTNINAPTDLV